MGFRDCINLVNIGTDTRYSSTMAIVGNGDCKRGNLVVLGSVHCYIVFDSITSLTFGKEILIMERIDGDLKFYWIILIG